jgi:hypothetical protein
MWIILDFDKVFIWSALLLEHVESERQKEWECIYRADSDDVISRFGRLDAGKCAKFYKILFTEF